MPNQISLDRFLTYVEIAQRWNRSPRRVRELMGTGRMPGALKLGATWSIGLDDLIAYENSLKAG